MQNSLSKNLEPIIWVVLVYTLCFAWQSGAVFGYLTGVLSWSTFLIALLASILFLWVFIGWGWKRGWDIRLALLAALLTTVTGPFGLSVGWLALLGQWLYFRWSTPAIVWILLLEKSQTKKTRAQLVYERIQSKEFLLEREKTPLALHDIMDYGSSLQKREVIEKVLRYYCPEFAQILHKGVQDSDHGIRVLAATAILYIQGNYIREIDHTVKELQKQGPKQRLYFQLGTLCLQMLQTNLLDHERIVKYGEKGIDAFHYFIDLGLEDGEIFENTGILFAYIGKWEQGKENLEWCVADPSFQFSIEGMFSLMKVYFKLRNFSALRALSLLKNRVRFGREYERQKLFQLLDYWSQGVCTN